MFKLISTEMIVPNLHRLVISAPEVAREVQPGQFVIVRVEEDGERIPLSIADWDREEGTVTVIVMNAGSTTDKLAMQQAGSDLPTVVGPLGNATEIEKYGTVLCIGGCYGIGSIYPIARALREQGNRVITVIEARSSFLIYWEQQLAAVSDRLFRITRDGTAGLRGHIDRISEIIAEEGPIDRTIINGCTLLLSRGSAATRQPAIPTFVSLNPIMIDGTGMCGVCRVSVGSETRFACVDGPDFDGHQVDWEELRQRRRTYLREEVIPLHSSGCGQTDHKSQG